MNIRRTARTIARLGTAALLAATLPLAMFNHQTSEAASSPAARLSAVGTLLYQADWSTGLDGWKTYAGFRVAKGVLTFDGRGDDGAFAPYALNGRQNFAIEAVIQVGAPIRPKAAFDIFVRRSYVNQTSGVFAGYDADGGESTARNLADLFWNANNQSYYVPGGALHLDRRFHTYRLEVRDNAYRLLEDGKVLVPETLIGQTAFASVGLSFTYIPATVKAFTVLALPPAPITTQANTNRCRSHALTATDVNIPASDTIFRDNSRYMIDAQLSAATLAGMGRIFGCVAFFQDSHSFINESVNLHSSAAGAKMVLNFFAGRGVRAVSTMTGFQTLQFPAPGVGDAYTAYSYQYLDQGQTYFVTKVLFRRGPYYVAVTVESTDILVAEKGLALARRADARVQGGR